MQTSRHDIDFMLFSAYAIRFLIKKGLSQAHFSSIVIEVIGRVLLFFMKDILNVKNTNKSI